VGKEYRAIGNIHTAKADSKAAEANFKKALKIFHDLGDQRLARDIRMKISSLQMHQ
jgi:predicted negative regulator of RcsB-dependent stress response